MASSITVQHGDRTLTIPIRYSRFGSDLILPLVTEIVSSLSALAVCAHQRSLGHAALGDQRGVTLGFMEKDAESRLTRAWNEAQRIINE